MSGSGAINSNTQNGYDYGFKDKKPFDEGFAGGAYVAHQAQPPVIFGDNTGVHLTPDQRNKSIFC